MKVYNPQIKGLIYKSYRIKGEEASSGNLPIIWLTESVRRAVCTWISPVHPTHPSMVWLEKSGIIYLIKQFIVMSVDAEIH